MSFPGIEVVAPSTTELAALERIILLIQRAEPRVRRRFLQSVGVARNVGTLEEIAALLDVGRIDDALAISSGIAESVSNQLEQAYLAAGLSTAAVLSQQLEGLVDFNGTNVRAVDVLQRNRLRLVAEFNAQQRAASQIILQDAFTRGLAPIEQARALRGSIGLSSNQAQFVVNYRRQLETGSKASLRRAQRRVLRDHRFDGSVNAAIRGDRVLSAGQIDRMVERYELRLIGARAKTIAITETTAAVHAGDLEMWEQAIGQGKFLAIDVVSIWKDRDDSNVRASHRFMDKQEQPIGNSFLSGLGNRLRFPGDPLAPAADTIHCRCVVGRFLKAQAQRASLSTRLVPLAA